MPESARRDTPTPPAARSAAPPANPTESRDGAKPLRGSQDVDAAGLRLLGQQLFDDRFRLALVAASELASSPGVHRVAYVFIAPDPDRRIELVATVDAAAAALPSLALLSFCAGRFERELFDTHGILALTEPPSPSRRTCQRARSSLGPARANASTQSSTSIAARRVERQAPGHRPGGLLPRVERAAPDCGFAHALAYCLAVEEAFAWPMPPLVALLRSFLLEMERVHENVRYLGRMCAEAGLMVLAAEFVDLRQSLLRMNVAMCGHPLLRGATTPGGVCVDRLPSSGQLRGIGTTAAALVTAAASHPAVRDDWAGTAVLTSRHAEFLGVTGFVARASGQRTDARRDHPFHPDAAALELVTETDGDALARFLVRAREIQASIGLLCRLRAQAHPARLPAARPPTGDSGPLRGLGVVEGSRGTIVHRVEASRAGRITALRIVDPSFLVQPALALVVASGPVTDVATVNQSFDLPAAGGIR